MNKFHNNKLTFRVLLVFLIFIFGKNGITQTSISGKVTDQETGEEMIAANIVVFKSGVFIQGATTDIDGNYSIRIDAGIYDLEISYTGYVTQRIVEVVVNENQVTKVGVQLNGGEFIDWGGGCLWDFNVPLIKQDDTSSGQTYDSDKLENLPTRNINKIITITPGVSFTQ